MKINRLQARYTYLLEARDGATVELDNSQALIKRADDLLFELEETAKSWPFNSDPPTLPVWDYGVAQSIAAPAHSSSNIHAARRYKWLHFCFSNQIEEMKKEGILHLHWQAILNVFQIGTPGSAHDLSKEELEHFIKFAIFAELHQHPNLVDRMCEEHKRVCGRDVERQLFRCFDQDVMENGKGPIKPVSVDDTEESLALKVEAIARLQPAKVDYEKPFRDNVLAMYESWPKSEEEDGNAKKRRRQEK